MKDTELIHVWQGERKLLPTQQTRYVYQLRCVQGSGYLRLMSKSNRQFIKPGDLMTVLGGEIATVSGNEPMVVELKVNK